MANEMIGDARPHESGVSAKDLLYLTDNSRPSLQLFRLRAHAQESRIGLLATWTPTVEHMLKDSLLLIAAANSADSALRQEILQSVATDLSKICLYGIADERRRELYALSLKEKLTAKLVPTLLEGRTLLDQVDCLPGYDLDCELYISSRAAVGQLSGKG